jgi:hypothetical protein
MNGEREATSHKQRYGSVVAFILANMTEEVKTEFEKAWNISFGGASPVEGLVLLYRRPDGSLLAKAQDITNESRKVSFKWTPSILAVVHTHPNTESPHPSRDDVWLSDRFRVPVFTITIRGMFAYDPATRKISRVMKNLTWLPHKRSAGLHVAAN